MTASPYRKVRQLTLEALYESETSNHPARAAFLRLLGERRQEDESLRKPAWEEFGLRAIAGVRERQPELDRLIQEAAPKYPVSTLAIVDRNILRLAIWELLSDNSAPVAAVINEAVELAHRYGGESSPAFVNGVLRTVSERLRGREESREGADAPVGEFREPSESSE